MGGVVGCLRCQLDGHSSLQDPPNPNSSAQHIQRRSLSLDLRTALLRQRAGQIVDRSDRELDARYHYVSPVIYSSF